MLAKTIRAYRLQKNFTQEYMAYRLGISQKAYSKIEAGITELTVRRLYEIASELEVPALELLSSTKEEFA
jgi:transcriptional regulator with XRE-family HTH domain